jgi:hypothetical protein
MPVYSFKSPSGKTLDLFRSVDSRNAPVTQDGEVYERVTAPERVHVLGVAENPHTQQARMRDGYARQERKQGSRFKSEFSKQQIREAWSI